MTNEEKFASLMTRLDQDAAAKEAFQKDPVAVIKEAGIPLVEEPPETPELTAEALAAAEKIVVKKKWWGLVIVMNEKATQDVIDGVSAGGPLAGAIAAAFGAAGIVSGGVAAAMGAGFAAAFALKVAEIKIVNDGKGVNWPITWLQWGAVAAAVPGGPASIVGAIMVFIHPVRN